MLIQKKKKRIYSDECGVGFELESKEKGKGKVKIWVVGKGREYAFFAFSRASGRFLAVEIRLCW